MVGSQYLYHDALIPHTPATMLPQRLCRSVALSKISRFCGCVVIGLSISTQALSISDSDSNDFFDLSLEELSQIQVSSSSLTPVQIKASPSTIYLYQQPQINTLGWLQLSDLLKFAPGIEYSNPYSWLQGGQRGSRGNWSTSKILLDGEPMNLLFTGEAWIGHQWLLPSISRVELVQGPSSILYGPDAFNGVINLVTDTDSTMEHMSLTLGANELQQWTLQAARGLKHGNWKAHWSGAMVQKQDRNFEDFVVTSDFSEVNQTERSQLLQTGSQSYRDNNVAAQVFASLNYAEAKQDGFHWKNKLAYFYDRDGGGLESPEISFQNFESIREQWLISSRFTQPIGLDNYSLKVAHRQDKELNLFNLREVVNDGMPGESSLSDLYHYDIDPSYRSSMDLSADWQFPSFENTTTILIGYEVEQIAKPFFELDDNNDLVPFLDRKESHLTIESRQKLSGFTLHLGSRFADHNLYDVPPVNRATLSYDFSEHLGGKIIYGTGFRAPTLFELEINNQLKPSEIENKEIQLSYRYNSNLDYKLVMYELNTKNATSIVFDSTGDGVDDFVATEIDTVESMGAEFVTRFQIAKVEGELWISFVDTKEFDGIQNWKAGGHGIYHFSDSMKASMQAKWVEGFDTQVLSDSNESVTRPLATYFTLDGSVSFHIYDQQFQLKVTNLTDSKNEYPNFRGNDPKYFPETGQTIQVSYTYRF